MGSQIADPTMHATALQHFEAGRLTEAAAACEAILHRSPRDWLALRLLGHVRNNQRAFDEAAHLFTAALQAATPNVPDEVSMLNGLAEALRGKRDFDGALDCYRRALTRNPRDVVTLQNHGSTLVALNRHAEALDCGRRVVTVIQLFRRSMVWLRVRRAGLLITIDSVIDSRRKEGRAFSRWSQV
jgi:tetratricopeptide (TPR) repeat protein